METLARQDYWDRSYDATTFRVASAVDSLRAWLEAHVPRTTAGRSLEIGCFPGTYSAVLGELGYELNGMDLAPRSDTELPTWLKACGYRVGDFSRRDFFKFAATPTYDLVCSFGFIEHFQDWDLVLRRHAEFVRPGGLLVVTTPNFRGAVQHLFHWLFDREALGRHNLRSMDVDQWPNALGPEMQTRWFGHFGRFTLWVEEQRRSVAQRAVLRAAFALLPTLRSAVRFDSQALSPFCGIVAERRA